MRKNLLNFFPKGSAIRKYLKRTAFQDGKLSKEEYKKLIGFGVDRKTLNKFTKEIRKSDSLKIGKGLAKEGKLGKIYDKKATAQNISDKLVKKADLSTGYKNQSENFKNKVTKSQFKELKSFNKGNIGPTLPGKNVPGPSAFPEYNPMYHFFLVILATRIKVKMMMVDLKMLMVVLKMMMVDLKMLMEEVESLTILYLNFLNQTLEKN